MLRFGLVLALTLPALLAQETPSPGEPGFVLYAASQLVVLNVGVQDNHGKNIKGLTAPAFKIFEDGHPQIIKQFAAEDRPVTLGILVDASGSMRTRQPEVVTAALAFVRAGNPQDETFVVNFNDRAFEGLPPPRSFFQQPAATKGRSPRAETRRKNRALRCARARSRSPRQRQMGKQGASADQRWRR